MVIEIVQKMFSRLVDDGLCDMVFDPEENDIKYTITDKGREYL